MSDRKYMQTKNKRDWFDILEVLFKVFKEKFIIS